MADYDEEFSPKNPDIKKNFWKLFLLLTGLIGFLGNHLLDGATLVRSILVEMKRPG